MPEAPGHREKVREEIKRRAMKFAYQSAKKDGATEESAHSYAEAAWQHYSEQAAYDILFGGDDDGGTENVE